MKKVFFMFFIWMFVGYHSFASENSLNMLTYDVDSGQWKMENNKTLTFDEEKSDKQQNTIEPYSIIGSDDRVKISDTTKLPYRFICSLMAFDKDEIPVSEGTAWLAGKNIAVTAGHNIYNGKNEIGTIYIMPGENGEKFPYGKIKVTKVHVPAAFKEFKDQHPDAMRPMYDFAILELEKPIGAEIGYFGLATYNATDNGVFDIYENEYTVSITGYPGDDKYKDLFYSSMARATGKCYFDSSDYRLYYHIDTTQGESGAPIYYREGSKFYVLGIHLAGKNPNGWNRGRLMTKALAQLIYSYR